MPHCGSNKITNPYVSFKVATYNVHRWVGRDDRYNPDRVVGVLRELNADIVCLQEVVSPARERFDPQSTIVALDQYAAMSKMRVICGPTFFKQDGYFGNLVLTSYPVHNIQRIDLSVKTREPRGAIDVKLDIKGFDVRLIATHLGLRAFERNIQIKKLLGGMASSETDTIILAGDFNEWFPASKVLRRIRARFGYSPMLRTFPSRFPLLALDRIWVRPAKIVANIKVYNTPLARSASDHLPLVANFSLF